MSIQDKLSQFKGYCTSTDVILTVLIVVVSIASFCLGRASVQGNIAVSGQQDAQVIKSVASEAVKAENVSVPSSTNTANATPVSGAETQKGYVASKSGTKYHLSWCGSAKQIKEENKIWFATKEEAEKVGYSPASNCKGI